MREGILREDLSKRTLKTVTLSEELQWRGLLQQSTYADISLLDKETRTFYHGYDASADSQTVGNLAAMMLDKLLMRHGYRAIILAGGATSLIGDPGGKDKERPMQTEETIAHNVQKAQEQLAKIFQGHDFMLVNNLDWTRDLGVLPFLRDIGKHFSMTPLIQRDYIADRIGEGGSGISYTEFSYTILQGMDYLHLFDTEQTTLQIGGSDQWGNCLSGVELVRKARGAEVHALTLPLIINKATGRKFGKSEEGAIWLDESKTSVYSFYQFWINADDEGVEGYLKVFTEIQKGELEELMNRHRERPQERLAQRRLAELATTIVHGVEKTMQAKKATEVIDGTLAIADVSDEVLRTLEHELPVYHVDEGMSIISALVGGGLVASNSEARRLLTSRAVYLNGNQVEREVFEETDFNMGMMLLRRGKALKDTVVVKRGGF